MVRRGTLLLGAGAAVAVGVGGYLIYQLKSNGSAVAQEAGSSDPAVPLAVESDGGQRQQANEAVGDGENGAVCPAPTTDAVATPADPVAAVLKDNIALLSDKDRALAAVLLELEQAHVYEGWPALGTDDALKRGLLSQLSALDASYPGGLPAYLRNARRLLQESKEGVNPFEGYVPSVPAGVRLDFGAPDFLELEGRGLEAAGRAAFVLVAGGLGERLGYSGIKVALPCESASGTPFLGLYVSTILALQARAGRGRRLPLAIMTSDDTHERTAALLKAHNNFGMEEGQITLLKQAKVACLTDNAAHLALEGPGGRWGVQTKPHGHGDVHMLLAGSGLAKKWLAEGFEWVCFFQDTNALVFRGLLPALGVSAAHGYDVNSLAVPRRAGEAIGAITRLTRADGGGGLTVNVEYNQLEPLLRAASGGKQGDVNDPQTGYSPFPGNINQLVLRLASYVPQLEASGGVISEFVNPKYKDATKTAFKSSTRLECMMQDYPKALPPSAKVGFTTINQVWASYSPVKNSPADAAAKFREGNPTHSATTGELDIYKSHCLALAQQAGAVLPDPLPAPTFNGITTEAYPAVVLDPSFAPTLSELKSKVAPGSLKLAAGSVLLLEGPDIRIAGPLEVRGALVVRAVPGARVTLGRLVVENAGWSWQALAEGEAAPEEERIRGFKVVRKETMELVFDKPGEYVVPEAEPEAEHPAAEVAAAPAVEAVEPAVPSPAPTAEVVEAAPGVASEAGTAEELKASSASQTVGAPTPVATATEETAAGAEAEPEPAAEVAEAAGAAGEVVVAEPEEEPAAADDEAADTEAATGTDAAAPASSSGLSVEAKPFVPGGTAAPASAAAPPAKASATKSTTSGSKSGKKGKGKRR